MPLPSSILVVNFDLDLVTKLILQLSLKKVLMLGLGLIPRTMHKIDVIQQLAFLS